ncbi:MAG: class D beta-lactamase [Paucibacter sp.]|nr:class D beta-lactamase [Roseateles sp.]
MYLKRLALGIALAGLAATAQARVVCTVLADAATGSILHSKGDCATRVTPASTFKMAISLMGYDAGFLQDEHTPALPYKEGYVDWREEWKQTTDAQRWMKLSVVWFSQQVTQTLGEKSVQHYVDTFNYGNRDMRGDPGEHNGLTAAWLNSSLKISPLEQIEFQRKIANRSLPVSAHAYDMTDRITLQDQRPDGWELHAKIGGAGGNGWYVGRANKDGRTILFARLIHDDQPQDTPSGYRARDEFLPEMPGLLNKFK